MSKQKKLLVVDDDPNIVQLLKNRLTHAGYLIETAENGEEALERYRNALKSMPYDLILLDLMMPGIHGMDVLKKIRSEEVASNVNSEDKAKIVILTAYTESKAATLLHGANDNCDKPFIAEVLLPKIETTLNS